MRVPPAPPPREGAAFPSWLEPSSDEQADAEDKTEPGSARIHPRALAGAAMVGDELVDIGGAFFDRLATGTGQFEMPAPRKGLRGSPDDAVSRIMSRKVVCARPEMDASLMRERLLERGVSGAPVVDDWGRVLGVVSKSDLVEHEVTSQRSGAVVADIMMPMAFTVPASASIGQAAALMAYEGVHRVVVVDGQGCVVGLVSALDIARWVGWCARYPVGREP